MKSRAVTMALVSAGLSLAIAGCGSGTSTPSNTASTTPQKGGTLVFALPPQTNLNWFMPLVNSGFDSVYNFQLINQLYKPLIWINKSYGINWHSSIAKKIVPNQSGTVYHVYLHKKWKWSNGTPVTTKDILFDWHMIQATSASNAPKPWPYVMAGVGDIPNGVKSLVANNNYEFTVTLKQPANQQWFIYNGLEQFYPLPSSWNKYPSNITQEITYLGKQGVNPSFDSVVDGPFKLQKAVPSQSWTLVPNPQYSGHKPYVNKLIFAFQGSNNAEFAALKTGQVNVGYLDLAQYGARSSLTSQNMKIRPLYPFGYFDTELNLQTNAPGQLGQVFQQLYVRQALMMGINQNAINQAIYHGYAPPQYGPIPSKPTSIFLDSKLTKPIYPYSPSQGKKLLQQHGWTLKNGVMTNRAGTPLSFTLLYASGSGAVTHEVEIMQQGWAQEGVHVTLKPMPFSQLETTISGGGQPWAAAAGQGIAYGGSYPTGGELFGTHGGFNNFGYSNLKEDALIAATHKPYPTPAETMAHYKAYENYTAQDLPVLWNNNVGTLQVNAATVHNSYKYSNSMTDQPQFQYWWMSK